MLVYQNIHETFHTILSFNPFHIPFHSIPFSILHISFDVTQIGMCSWNSWECAAVVHENVLQALDDNHGNLALSKFADIGIFEYHRNHGIGTSTGTSTSSSTIAGTIAGTSAGTNTGDAVKMEMMSSNGFERFSINALALTQSDLRLVGSAPQAEAQRLFDDDEKYLSSQFPKYVHRHQQVYDSQNNGDAMLVDPFAVAVGDAVFVHYAYGPQERMLDERTNILERYAAFANALANNTPPPNVGARSYFGKTKSKSKPSTKELHVEL